MTDVCCLSALTSTILGICGLFIPKVHTIIVLWSFGLTALAQIIDQYTQKMIKVVLLLLAIEPKSFRLRSIAGVEDSGGNSIRSVESDILRVAEEATWIETFEDVVAF